VIEECNEGMNGLLKIDIVLPERIVCINQEVVFHILSFPMLIIWGKQDNLLVPNLYLPRWHRLGANPTIVEIDRAEQLADEDQSKQINSLLLRFLDS
jgi:pimeloyl-ACP methyl ester carboxylesterase